MKKFIVLGAAFAFLAVAIGAFGAHALADVLTGKWSGTYETGVQYHMYHALGLIGIGIIGQFNHHHKLLNAAGWLMALGIVLFSGSLYVMSITKIELLGIITPFGGVAFLVSWLLVILAVLKQK